MNSSTTQSKYRKKSKSDAPASIEQNEVRIKGNQGNVKRYVEYACSLLEGTRLPEKEAETDNKEEKKSEEENAKEETEKVEPVKFDTIVLKATGRAINKAVTTAEVVKRRIADLHQVTSLETLEIVDVWEPLEEGLQEVETKRRVASITITLSRDSKAVDPNSAGYQPPISSDAIKTFSTSSRPPRRFRGGMGGGFGRRGGGGGGRGGFRGPMRRGGGGMGRGGRRGGPGPMRRGGPRRGGMRGGGGGGGGGGQGFGGGNRSPNRSPMRGGYGGPRGGRGRGRGGYNRNNRGGGGGQRYGGGRQQY